MDPYLLQNATMLKKKQTYTKVQGEEERDKKLPSIPPCHDDTKHYSLEKGRGMSN